jgi:hypothetical protein
MKFHLNLQLHEAGRETRASSLSVVIDSAMTALLFMGAAPEAVALQLLTHRYDACSTKEGCAGIFMSITIIRANQHPAHYMPARAKNLRNCAAIGRMLESRRRIQSSSLRSSVV